MEKRINIKYPDGSLHEVIAYSIDNTEEGLLILSYYDVTNGRHIDSYTPITNIDGVWYKVPEHRNWNEYHFLEHNENISRTIINKLPDNIESYTPEKQRELEFIKQQQKKETKPKPKEKASNPLIPPSPPSYNPNNKEKNKQENMYLYNYYKPLPTENILISTIKVHVLENLFDNVYYKGKKEKNQTIFIEYEYSEKQKDGRIVQKFCFINIDELSEEQFDTVLDNNIQIIKKLATEHKSEYKMDINSRIKFNYYNVEDKELSLYLNENKVDTLIVNKEFSNNLSRAINGTIPLHGFYNNNVIYDNGVEFISENEDDYKPTFRHYKSY